MPRAQRPPRTSLIFDAEEIGIYEWHPDKHAKKPPEQVHLVITPKAKGLSTIVIRFKSPHTLNAVVDALIEHRDSVWGSKSGGDELPF